MARPEPKKSCHNRHAIPAVFSWQAKRRIGILGGSFNPAHDGHLSLSDAARQKARLDEIWWLVSPQNPLKQTDDMAMFDKRLANARALAQYRPWLRVLAIEELSGTTNTIDSLRFIIRHAPRSRFIWLMGTDNLVQFPHWHKAHELSRLLPFLVFRRQGSFYQATASYGRQLFGAHGRKRNLSRLASAQPPALAIAPDFIHNLSATDLRKKGLWP